MSKVPSQALLVLLFAMTAMNLSGATPAPGAPGLWRVYNDAFARAKYVDLTHTIAPGIPVWKGFGPFKFAPTVNPQTGRIHTSYSQTTAATGRLASLNPNLQNIPIRTEEGRKIRRAFIADPGTKLVSADYSQIELRLLAEIADIPALKQAFRDGLDIHAMTASEMFGVPVKDMPSDVRRRAKAINFGIIYGISAFGLANQLGIAREEAGAYIRKYFERFPGIRAYMDETKAFCKQHGYVLTLFGRKCHYPDIVNPNPSIRAFNERAAINARLQGTAADIIRRAMVRMDAALASHKLAARMLLQVHDELLFEVPDPEVEQASALARRCMESVVELAVPLLVELKSGANWAALK
jgi:DNA polymerase-1